MVDYIKHIKKNEDFFNDQIDKEIMISKWINKFFYNFNKFVICYLLIMIVGSKDLNKALIFENSKRDCYEKNKLASKLFLFRIDKIFKVN